MQHIIRPTLTLAVVLTAATATAESPATDFTHTAVFAAEAVGTEAHKVKALDRQMAESRSPSAHVSRLFDADDRRMFRELTAVAKKRGKSQSRKLHRVTAKRTAAIPEHLHAFGFDAIRSHLHADGLRLKRTTRRTFLRTNEANKEGDGDYQKYRRSNAYVRMVNNKVRDVYTWDHYVIADRSVYEGKNHNLFVYADDGRLDRVYQWSPNADGVAYLRVKVQWANDSDVAGFELRSARGQTTFEVQNWFEISEFRAPPVALAKK